MLAKEFFAALLAFFGKRDRFRLSHRIEDHPFFVQPVHCVPIVSLPCAPVAVEREKEKREYHLVDFVFVVVHMVKLSLFSARFNRSHLPTVTQKPNKAPEPTTMAVTTRAPSSTARASHGRGSS